MSSRKPPSQIDPSYVQQRHARSLQSMVPGTMHGRIANASPLPAARENLATTQEIVEAVFSYHGPLSPAVSLPYLVPTNAKLVRVAAVLDVPGSSATTFGILHNEVQATTVTVAGGAKSVIFTLIVSIVLGAGDRVQVQTNVAGAGASGATVQVGYSEM